MSTPAMGAESVAPARAPGRTPDAGPFARAQLYHFLELAVAHPAPEGLSCFRAQATELACAAALNDALADDDTRGRALASATRFFRALRDHDDAQVESAHIELFSAGFPTLPCPPYGSLFTVQGDKRLEEMRRIKDFYQRNGFELDEAFTDLPDHLCVELEFLQALCFREHEALCAGDGVLATEARAAQLQFLDDHLLPFARGIAESARIQHTPSFYADLLALVAACAEGHRRAFGIAARCSH